MTELTAEKINDLMQQMPEEARDIFRKCLMKEASEVPMRIIRAFVEKFDAESPVDALIASISSKFMHDISKSISEALEDKSTKTGAEVGVIAASSLRNVADQLDKSIMEHSKHTSNGLN